MVTVKFRRLLRVLPYGTTPSGRSGRFAVGKTSAVLAFFLLVVWQTAAANVIPPPFEEWLDIRIEPSSGTLRARVDGFYYIRLWDDAPTSISFPVPPLSSITGVWDLSPPAGETPVEWDWTSEQYYTILPEIPLIPMIRWYTDLPPEPWYYLDLRYRVIYDHDLIPRGKNFIYFYALGSGRYFATPENEYTLSATINISVPLGFIVDGVWLDTDPFPYTRTDSGVQILLQSWQEPVTRDLIVRLIPKALPAAWYMY